MATSQSNIHRLRNEIARLEKSLSQERKKVAGLSKDIASLRKALAKSPGNATKSHHLSSKLEDHAHAESRIADWSRRISDKSAALARDLAKASTEADKERKKLEAQEKRRQETELKHAKEVSREMEKQARLSTNMQRYSMFSRQALPAKITVLYLASNPVDQSLLALDEEVRLIQEKIRMSDFRDSIDFVTKWAVRTTDLLQALNEVNPDVIHISGHGTPDKIFFLGPDSLTKPISIDTFVQLVQTASNNLKVIIFNTCNSENFAEAVLVYVPIVIGMQEEISDETARIFAGQFYSSIGFGKSMQTAFDQARAAIAVEGVNGEQSPMLFVRSDLNAADVFLVQGN